MYAVETYKVHEGRQYRVLVLRITSPEQVTGEGDDSLHAALESSGLGQTVGLYFYRFAQLDAEQPAFTKIGETTHSKGIAHRKRRGWIYKEGGRDSYRRPNDAGVYKLVYTDVQAASDERPMYFVYYELDVEGAFPKLDEMMAFYKHGQHFGRSTRNIERVNTHPRIGRKLLWHEQAFDEVLAMRLPSGDPYPGLQDEAAP